MSKKDDELKQLEEQNKDVNEKLTATCQHLTIRTQELTETLNTLESKEVNVTPLHDDNCKTVQDNILT